MVGLARFLWMAGMCLNFVGPDALIGPLGGSFHRKSFAALAATYFAHGGKVGKTPPGTRPMDYGSALLRLGP